MRPDSYGWMPPPSLPEPEPPPFPIAAPPPPMVDMPPPRPLLLAVDDVRPAATKPAPILEPKRNWVDAARKAVRYAAIAFAGWLALVLLAILAYRLVDPPFSSLMAQQWVTGQQITQEWVAIDDISPDVVRAVMLSEDGRFCQHYGIDFDELQNAIDRAGEGGPRGASTISMQVIKNLFLWPSKSYVRKAIEVPLTYAMEAAWPKRRIMEVYLNIAEWGPGVFGVEAASQFHFNKPARDLSEREAARLAVALPNPLLRDAGDPGPRTRRLAADIQGRMRAAPASQTSCAVDAAARRRKPQRNADPETADDWDTMIRRGP